MTRTDTRDIETPINLLEQEEESRQSPIDRKERHGFLPIQTNWFDRIFISVIIWVALCLFWLRFLEPAGLPLVIANIIAGLIGIYIVWKG
ncbi:DUF2160 family membrane protein [Aurantimonas sp. VKM B-3413]|uniref:DUF2160 family membrane protein n=1 Tax=Aurantimonas sp. VKM B-3413 TaxID=2779401 RepID=UPI001E530208|nr:DUF2160 family membrane protein [Aurantimonas sp. VKM B-3413]MCB8837176.1 DUF2160 domain-containing protein [Aurantimonas sp. VKM B-3413]